MPLKIAFWNMGYFTGILGGLEYATRSSRFLFGSPKAVREEVTASLKRLMDEEAPDIVFLMEIDAKVSQLFEGFGLSRVDQKYLGEGLGVLPFLRHNSNGVFARRALPHRIHRLSYGTKKLLYVVDVSRDTSLLLGHFALGRAARTRQFEELSHLCEDKRIIVAGDFNTSDNEAELGELIKVRGLRIEHGGHTFPTKNPSRILDFVLVPTECASRTYVRDDIRMSDHLPLLLEIRL